MTINRNNQAYVTANAAWKAIVAAANAREHNFGTYTFGIGAVDRIVRGAGGDDYILEMLRQLELITPTGSQGHQEYWKVAVRRPLDLNRVRDYVRKQQSLWQKPATRAGAKAAKPGRFTSPNDQPPQVTILPQKTVDAESREARITELTDGLSDIAKYVDLLETKLRESMTDEEWLLFRAGR